MKMQIETLTLPAYWASALINGDYSGCTDSEEKEINDFLAANPHLGSCLDCSEETQLTRYNGMIAECLDYDFPVIFYRTSEAGINYLIYPAQVKTQPLAWQKMGLQFTASGCGSKIPTDKMVLLNGIWRRVYCTVYSNVGSCWINFDGKRVNVESIL